MVDTVELSTLIKYYDESISSTYNARTLAERDRDFYDGIQLTQQEISALKARGQNPVIFNRISSKIDFLIGAENQSRTDPKAFPRTPKHEDAAHSASDAIKFVCENNDFDQLATDAAKNLFIEGIQSVSVEVEKTPKGFEIKLIPIAWDRFVYDNHSTDRYFSDARFTAVVVWMDADEAKRRYKDKADQIDSRMAEYGSNNQTYDDKPRWYDQGRKRVMVIQMYFKHAGVWHYATFCHGAYLEGPNPSPYLDEDGQPENPHVAARAKMDRDNNSYGAVRVFIDPQKEINARRSKFLWQISARQTLSERGSVDDVDEARRQMTKADGHVEVNPNGRFEVLPTNDMSQGQIALYQDATQQIDATGVNATLQGKDSRDLSGRAQEQRGQAGMMELGPFFDTHRAFKRKIYRAIWNRIRQFWTDERWIRVTDDANNLRWIGLNAPFTLAEKMVMERFSIGLSDARSQYGQEIEQAYQLNPNLQQVVGVDNQAAEMDVDIKIEETPNVVNIQAEEFDKLVRLYEANPNGVPWDMIIEASNIRGKDKILDKSKPNPEAEAQQAQMQQQAIAMEMAEQEGKTRKLLAEADKAEQEAIQKGLENQLLVTQPTPVTSVAI